MNAVDEAMRHDGFVPVTPQAVSELCVEIKRLTAEVESLRAALGSIIVYTDDYCDMGPVGASWKSKEVADRIASARMLLNQQRTSNDTD